MLAALLYSIKCGVIVLICSNMCKIIILAEVLT
jgi:hypothetical protein